MLGRIFAGVDSFTFRGTDAGGLSSTATVSLTVVSVNGTGGNDSLTGTGQGDFIDGLVGDDTIDGGAGDDRLVGEGGNDSLAYPTS